MTTSLAYDIFIDLTRSTLATESMVQHLGRLDAEEGLFGDGRRVCLALPSHIATAVDAFAPACAYRDPVEALSAAVSGAAASGRGLAVVVGGWHWRNQTLCALGEYADVDPMIATLQPRFSDHAERSLIPLPGASDQELPKLASAYLPAYTITPECLSVIFMLTPRGARAAPRLSGSDLEAAYGHLLRGLRRRGFRNLVCNWITVPIPPALGSAYLPLAWKFSESLPSDAEQPTCWLRDLPERRIESLLASAFSQEGCPRLLLDCRGLPAFYNGTASCILGFLRGFSQLTEHGFAITVLASPQAAEFHRLSAQFETFEVVVEFPRTSFLVAINLNQPWSIEAIRDLHGVAGIIMFNILDTIAWDIIHPAPPSLGSTWRVLGATADAIFFNSAYSRDRYRVRFRPDPAIPLVVTHHSTAPAENLHPSAGDPPPSEPFLLLFGNDYDHKDVAPTLSALTEAFPFTKIFAVGVAEFPSSNVVCMPSGRIAASTIGTLLSHAKAVVFPSHYEGFGLPVVEGLAYGKPVIVRDCPLWTEIARLSPRSELIESYKVEADLVRAVGRALRGEPRGRRESPAGAATPVELTWKDCARVMVETAEQLVSAFDGQRWLSRQSLIAG